MNGDDTTLDYTGGAPEKYRILKKLGEGGMGFVHLVEDAAGTRYAMKTVRPEVCENEDLARRFVREMKLCAMVEHPNVVRTIEVGLSPQGTPFIVSEFCPGGSLQDVLEEQGRIGPADAIAWLRQIASALDHIWRKHTIIHRDIKPANVLLGSRREAKLADLGLARRTVGESCQLTAEGTIMGSPHYISPEQADGYTELDTRADLYSLGASFYQLLSGRTLFTGDTAMAILVKHVNDAPEPLDSVQTGLPPDLVRIIHRLVEKKREDRPRDPAELLSLLRALDGEPAKPESWAQPTMIEEPPAALSKEGDSLEASLMLMSAGAMPVPQEVRPQFACVMDASAAWPQPRAHVRVNDPTRGANLDVAVYAEPSVEFGRSPGGEVAMPLRVYPIGENLDACKRISSRHGRFNATAAGWEVTDAGSHNGTALDGRSLAAQTPAPLTSTSSLSVGATLQLTCVAASRNCPKHVEVEGNVREMSDAPALVITRPANRPELMYVLLRDRIQVGGEPGAGLVPPGAAMPHAGAIWWFSGRFWWEARLASSVGETMAYAGQLVAVPPGGVVRVGAMEMTFGALEAKLFD